ncbi:MAG: type II toxin-antitoxin system CcdA family antitoxin [Rhodocyclaceae bacterium]|nr:type II toxin-antitoxin system CcdA family antitoxin [Rhodocyclaceae bacterium]MDP1956966.1 type II toxin-antitoxin system CcdA family antitoxin [Rhodocyclaceae bacterium]
MNQTITPARKATNITLSADVLSEAKALGINISKSCDELLRNLVARDGRGARADSQKPGGIARHQTR